MSTGRQSNWYHGRLTRLEAEDVLKTRGFTEGLYLVRDSCSASGDFVLSVVHASSVIHYQIRRRGNEDALFSLADEPKVIHGLDELVFYYTNASNTGLQHSLLQYVEANECPQSVRLHGVENLLHRATASGSVKVVSELLKCNSGRDMNAKNHDGQCAVHLASFYGHTEVLATLIDFGVNVNIADSSGYSPLHVACQADQPDVVRLLLEARANPTVRNQITSWVPLHEAAWKGNIGCAKTLMELGDAPLLARTNKNETPADLARANGQNEMAELLDKWPTYQPNSNRENWLHMHGISRLKAVEALQDHGADNGTFLVRQSQKKKATYVLSMCYEKAFYHFEIETRGIYVFLDAGPYMQSLEHLVDHYTRFSDGLPCPLVSPVSPISRLRPISPNPPEPPRDHPKPKILAEYAFAAPMPQLPPRIKTRERNGNNPTNLKPIDKRKIYENNDTLRRVRHSKDNIPTEAIHMIQVIGEGEFGCVYKGLYMGESGHIQPVAVKVLSDMDEAQAKNFSTEAAVMMNLDHQSIVQLIGISSGPPVLIVLELVPLGSLLEFLHDHPDSVRTHMEIPLWAAQIACGMMYLVKQRFIHRDLAARNILLASKLQAKISDFGLSRVVGTGKDYYKASQGGRWPIKWYAPECINYGTFSHASDVWSYGVLLWEMYTYGSQPYDDMMGAQVLKFIEAGHRLPRPTHAELEIFSTMEWCWEYEPSKRPRFDELFRIFAENPEYLNVKELLLTQDLEKLCENVS